jgi:hypothetical protein
MYEINVVYVNMDLQVITKQKTAFATAFAYEYKHNPRNLVNPWYGRWMLELSNLFLLEPKVVIFPQLALWHVSEEGEQGGGGDVDKRDRVWLEADDIREGEEEDEENENDEDEESMAANTSISTISESNATSLVPDFSVVHFHAKLPTSSSLASSKTSTIIDNCHIPAIWEVKRHPTRNPKPHDTKKRTLTHYLAEAKKDVYRQASYLFHQLPDQSDVILGICSGDYWTHAIVRRDAIPSVTDLAGGYKKSTSNHTRVIWRQTVQLGTSTSNRRLEQIKEKVMMFS